MKFLLLSIIIPVFNEEKTICLLLDKLKNLQLTSNVEKEIILVNDGSTDNTENNIQKYIDNNNQMKIIYLSEIKNKGKGNAIHTALKIISGEFVIIQDADLEYNPENYNNLLNYIIQNECDVVYGSRFLERKNYNKPFYGHNWINKGLTSLSNIFSGLNLTDMETCYKLVKTELILSIDLREKRFGFEPEVTAKLAKIKDIIIKEIPIDYNGRNYSQNKKISWKDGFRAIYCILKYNLFIRS